MAEHDRARAAGGNDLDLVDLDLRALGDALEISGLLAPRQRIRSRIPLELHEVVGLAQPRIRVGDDERLVGVAFRPVHGLLTATTASAEAGLILFTAGVRDARARADVIDASPLSSRLSTGAHHATAKAPAHCCFSCSGVPPKWFRSIPSGIRMPGTWCGPGPTPSPVN